MATPSLANWRPAARFTFRTAAALLSIALIAAACGGTPGATTSPGTTQPAGGQTTPPGGGGGGGATLADGSWTAGTVHTVISGPINQTIDAPLFPASSVTVPGQTVLNYIAGDAATSIAIVIYPNDVAVAVTTTSFVGGGGSTSDAPCDASITRADANAVEGRVICTNAPVLSFGGTSQQLVNIDATFSATR